MDNKPLKRNEHIVKLSQDHHASLMFCWKIRLGIKKHIFAERLRKYVQYFYNNHFNPHFKEEEEILFSPLKDSKVQKAIDDHKKIQQNITEILACDGKKLHDQLLVLADMVDDHVRYEERVVFPFIEKELSSEQLMSIGKMISKVPLKDTYEDSFWIANKSL